MSCTGTSDCLCGCCAGTSVQTPQVELNPPRLPAVAYRAGTWASFKESMLARLSSSDYPALADLKTRDDDDFTIALLDSTAVMLDILTFYQERLVNESYLRTATQLRSLTELSRLIGYQPAPGVASSVYLAFSLKAAPGFAPDPSTPTITIPAGTQVQSVPVQGQKPQTFETSADIPAKADWNALPVESSAPFIPPGATSIYLSGTTTGLQTGDSLLILGVDRETAQGGSGSPSEQWDVVVLNEVETDTVRNLTYVAWDSRLSHVSGDGTSGSPTNWTSARIYAFRKKAALFGHNAPDPNLFVNNNGDSPAPQFPLLIDSGNTPWSWKKFCIPSSDEIDLDAPYPKIAAGSWFALVRKAFPEFRIFLLASVGIFRPPEIFFPTIYEAQLYKVKQARSVSLAKFSLSGKVTELAADFQDSTIGRTFPLQLTEVWAQSEELAIADQPLDYPLYGRFLDLKDLRPDLTGAKAVALFGTRQKITVADGVTTLAFEPDDGSGSVDLHPGDTLTITGPSPLPLNTDFSVPDWAAFPGQITLNVEDASGRPGSIQNARLGNFELAPSGAKDVQVSEVALVTSVSTATSPYPHTRILLQSSLLNCYDRFNTTVNANVGLATNGQSVSEILGSGSAATPNQSFVPKQAPLTFIQAPTETGRQSTLVVRVNQVEWTEVPSLFEQSPSGQVYSTLNQSDGTARIQFGDGIEGSTLPTGQNNVQADYRIGSGSGGNVATGSITTLMDRPLGVTGVTNPQRATGGQDPAGIDDLRSDAPQTVLTLGRAVSITDYQSFAATYAGIAKAHAIWIPAGPGRGVFLTVAGVGGAALPPGNPTLSNLVASLRNFGNPLIPITARSFLETLFGFSADLRIDPKYDAPTVKAQVLQTLQTTYSFAARTFGQGISSDEIAAAIQAVPGIVAVNVTNIHLVATSAGGDLASQNGGFSLLNLNNWLAQQVTLPRPFSDSPMRICAYLPVPSVTDVPLAAEILVLDPDPTSVVLGVMA
jgi:hypothetical protein